MDEIKRDNLFGGILEAAFTDAASSVKYVDKEDLPDDPRAAWAYVTAVANRDIARCLLLGTAWSGQLIWHKTEKDYLCAFSAQEGQDWFEHICDMASEDPVEVRRKAEAMARKGWKDDG